MPAQQNVSSSGCGVKSRMVLPCKSSSRLCGCDKRGKAQAPARIRMSLRVRTIEDELYPGWRGFATGYWTGVAAAHPIKNDPAYRFWYGIAIRFIFRLHHGFPC